MTFDTLHKTICCIGPGLCIMPEVNFAFWAFSEVELPIYGVLRSSQGRLNHMIHRCVKIGVWVVWRGSPTKRRRKLYGHYAQRILEAWDARARGRSGPGPLVRRRGSQTANENGSDPEL